MDTTHIHVADDATLEAACDLIRDSELADDDLRFDRSRQTAVFAFWKADDDLSAFERAGLFTGWRVSPMRRLELTFRSVIGLELIRQSSGTGEHPVGGIRWDKRKTVCIDTYDGVTVVLNIGGLDATLQITDQVDRNRTQRSRRWSLWWGARAPVRP